MDPQSIARARELVRSFRQIYRTMTQIMRTHAETFGLTPVQMLEVRTLAEESNLSLSELADRIQLGCSTVSGVVKRLVDCGVVERHRLDEDQRTVAIRLTEKGNQLDRQVFEDDSLMSDVLDRFVQLPQQDVNTMLKLHQQLIDILNAEVETYAVIDRGEKPKK